ncbi:hypothetical protein CB1_000977017 [Camelus ferus]|nr:hypothetical protein CB1_000977017 [Camelus ferus]
MAFPGVSLAVPGARPPPAPSPCGQVPPKQQESGVWVICLDVSVSVPSHRNSQRNTGRSLRPAWTAHLKHLDEERKRKPHGASPLSSAERVLPTGTAWTCHLHNTDNPRKDAQGTTRFRTDRVQDSGDQEHAVHRQRGFSNPAPDLDALMSQSQLPLKPLCTRNLSPAGPCPHAAMDDSIHLPVSPEDPAALQLPLQIPASGPTGLSAARQTPVLLFTALLSSPLPSVHLPGHSAVHLLRTLSPHHPASHVPPSSPGPHGLALGPSWSTASSQ